MSPGSTIVVKNVEQLTIDSVSIELDIPAELRNAYAYTHGQYITLEATIDGQKVRRSYSLYTSPTEGSWRVAVKQIPGGVFSTFAVNVLKAGDTLTAFSPDGNFYIPIDDTKKNRYVAFAAGSGITPITSIMKSHLQGEPDCHFKLFLLNRSVSSIILREEIEGLKNIFLSRVEINYFLSRQQRQNPLFNGRFTSEKITQLSESFFNPLETDAFFLCGPQEMVITIQDTLTQMGVPKEKIHFELFFTSADGETQKQIEEIVEHQSEYATIHVIDGDRKMEVPMTKSQTSILDAALDYQADLPFACKGGVCCTCKAKLVEGEVKMKLNYGLEDHEVEAGYILTCQAIPVTESVTVDFNI